MDANDRASEENILLAFFGRCALHYGLRESLQGIQSLVGQILQRHLSVHNLQGTLRIACNLEFVAIPPGCQF